MPQLQLRRAWAGLFRAFDVVLAPGFLDHVRRVSLVLGPSCRGIAQSIRMLMRVTTSRHFCRLGILAHERLR